MDKEIPITRGTGRAPTRLAAFDAALFAAGIANYNLIHLSSVIPEGCRPIVRQVDRNDVEYGFKLYVVLATATATVIGKQAWAGVGWVLVEGAAPRGLFVEHAGSSEHEVRAAIQASLTSMIGYRRETFGEIRQEVV